MMSEHVPCQVVPRTQHLQQETILQRKLLQEVLHMIPRTLNIPCLDFKELERDPTLMRKIPDPIASFVHESQFQ